MQDNRGARLILPLFSIAFGIAACAPAIGDFGRPRPSPLFDSAPPLIEAEPAGQGGGAVSRFDLTDDEKQLRDLSWSLVHPLHGRDWMTSYSGELQRARLPATANARLDPKTFYMLLRGTPFRSSGARYARISGNAETDARLLRPFRSAACRVLTADRERRRVARSLSDLSRQEIAGMEARIRENRTIVEWVLSALRFRISAYRYALDRLQVETPTATGVFDVNQAIDILEWQVEDPDGLTRCLDGDAGTDSSGR